MKNPNCFECIHRRSIPGDVHSNCAKKDAKVTISTHGFKNGWVNWPQNFDPIWIKKCNSFEKK